VRGHDSGGGEIPMNEEALNLSIRKFLKTVGVNSQREIEHAVAKAAAAGAIAGTESFPAKMMLEIVGLKVKVEFTGDITLQ
jgi:predicted lactoylglutathione lyase